MIKNVIYKFVPLSVLTFLMTGCTEEQVEASFEGAAGAVTYFGPEGAIAGLGLTTVLALYKLYKGKGELKDVVGAFQKSKAKLPLKSKEILSEQLTKHLPFKLSDKIQKIKKKLK